MPVTLPTVSSAHAEARSTNIAGPLDGFVAQRPGKPGRQMFLTVL
jgi:hypothetical protein